MLGKITKTQAVVTAVIGLSITLSACLGERGDTKTLSQIKNREISLYCNLRGSDFTLVDPNKVVKVQPEFDGHPTEYIFNNGYATQCYTVTNK